VQASDVVIAIGEGYGTLSEIALALRAGKHVVGLQTWQLAEADARMHVVTSVAEAVRLAREHAAKT
jgi:predicted Rossmann-fold nucleotide-binding protein